MTSASYDPAFFDRVMTQSPTPIWEEGAESGDMEVEPDRPLEIAPPARQVGGRRYGVRGAAATYLVGPASGAGMGVGPGGINVGIGMEGVGEGEEAENFRLGSTLSQDGFPAREFDFMLSNPPYGKSQKLSRPSTRR